MKLVIASDIHGSAYWCRKLMAAIDAEAPDTVLVLGDLLYHGPRNDLPREYAPKQVLAMLNGLANRVIAVRGNCDSEVDQMVLDFPMMADYALVVDGGAAVQMGAMASLPGATTLSKGLDEAGATRSGVGIRSGEPLGASVAVGPLRMFSTHGHLFNPDHLPKFAGEAFLYGHTHVKQNEVVGGVRLFNPGSVSIPKDGSNSFGMYENGVFEHRLLG